MPIILAIEPDKRQAAHLSAIVRHRVGAELIVADTTEGALDAIGSRVPDLVLVPALLSPQDDAALAAALRVIAAAAHVRTLTIPVFANGVSHEERGGLLSRWRRGRSEASGGGCDPAVFAEQILDYLREAAAEREDAAELSASASAPAATAAPPPAVEPAYAEFEPFEAPPAATAATPAFEEYAPPQFEYAAEPVFEPIAAYETPAAAAPVAEPEFVREAPEFVREAPEFVRDTPQFVRDAPVEEPIEFMYAEPASSSYAAAPHAETPTEDESDDVVIDLSEDIEEISPETRAEELFDGEPMGIYTITGLDESLREFEAEPPARAAAPFDAASFDAPISRAPMPAPARVERTVVEPPLAAAASVEHERPKPAEPREPAWSAAGLRHGRAWPTLEGVVAESPASLVGLEEFSEALAPPPPTPPARPAAPVAPPPMPRAATPPPAPAPAPASAAKPDHLEWAELVASLRQDIERRRNQPAAAAAAAAAAKQAAAAKPSVAAKKPAPAPAVSPEPEHATVAAPARRRRAAAPVQDEWGLFDPEQCGFAALLAKLDEFSDTDDDTRQAS